MAHNRLGEAAWSIVAASAAALIGRLQDRPAGRHLALPWRSALINDRIQSRSQFGDGLSRLNALGLPGSQRAVALLLQIFHTILATLGDQRVEVHKHRRAI